MLHSIKIRGKKYVRVLRFLLDSLSSIPEKNMIGFWGQARNEWNSTWFDRTHRGSWADEGFTHQSPNLSLIRFPNLFFCSWLQVAVIFLSQKLWCVC